MISSFRLYRPLLIATIVVTIVVSMAVFAWAWWRVVQREVECVRLDMSSCPPVVEHVGEDE